MNRVRVVDKPLSFRPTTDQRKRIEHIATLLGSPGNLATAIRWALEHTPMPAQQSEVKNVRGK